MPLTEIDTTRFDEIRKVIQRELPDLNHEDLLAYAKQSRIDATKDVIEKQIPQADYEDLRVQFVYSEAIAKETGLNEITYDMLRAAAQEIESNIFKISPMRPDPDYIDSPHITITLKKN